ncbi:hypothetical protein C0992_011154, partial [Termitomyces sp. T32_za158]
VSAFYISRNSISTTSVGLCFETGVTVPTEDPYYQHDGRSRSRTESFPESFEDGTNPKWWTYEDLATNVPEIADFVRENEISGRAFLRFDDSVLDA